MWDEITYLFPNFIGATAEVLEWTSNFISRFMMDVIIYPFWKFIDVSKGAPSEYGIH